MLFFNNKLYMNTGNSINSFEDIRTMIITSGSYIRFNLSFPYSNYLYICCHAFDNNSRLTPCPVSALLNLNRTTYYDNFTLACAGDGYETWANLRNMSNTTLQIMLSYDDNGNLRQTVTGMIMYQYFA